MRGFCSISSCTFATAIATSNHEAQLQFLAGKFLFNSSSGSSDSLGIVGWNSSSAVKQCVDCTKGKSTRSRRNWSQRRVLKKALHEPRGGRVRSWPGYFMIRHLNCAVARGCGPPESKSTTEFAHLPRAIIRPAYRVVLRTRGLGSNPFCGSQICHIWKDRDRSGFVRFSSIDAIVCWVCVSSAMWMNFLHI